MSQNESNTQAASDVVLERTGARSYVCKKTSSMVLSRGAPHTSNFHPSARAKQYKQLRKQTSEKRIKRTARSVEPFPRAGLWQAGIRLATSFARLRLSDAIERPDADRAISMTKEAVGLRYDPETGEFDDQRTSRGSPRSQQKRRDAILDIIDTLDDGQLAIHDAVVGTAVAEYDTNRSKIEHDLETLRQTGKIYEPHGAGNGYRRSE